MSLGSFPDLQHVRISALEEKQDFIQSSVESLGGCSFCDLQKGYTGEEVGKALCHTY